MPFRYEALVHFVGGAIGTGEHDRQEREAQRRKALAVERTAEQHAQRAVLDEMQRFVPHSSRDAGQRLGLRRQVENQRHIEQRRKPEPRTTHSELCA
jgi:hypothetical protein